MPNFLKLRPFDDDGNLNMVVETPRGSAVKLKYARRDIASGR